MIFFLRQNSGKSINIQRNKKTTATKKISIVLTSVSLSLVLGGCEISGQVAPEIKEMAELSLHYSDYYMDKYLDALNNNVPNSSQYLPKAMNKARELNEETRIVEEKVVPNLDAKSADKTSDCSFAIGSYNTSYVLLLSEVVISKGAKILGGGSTSAQQQETLTEYEVKTKEMIDKCGL